MALTAAQIRYRDRILATAVADGKLVYGSKAWLGFRDTFDIDPSLAERAIAQLAPNPLAAARGGVPRQVPTSDEYDPAWLSAPERARINAARSGIQSSHALD
jgi:hypothetical protein